MATYCVYTTFGPKRPIATGILNKDTGKSKIYSLYDREAPRPIDDIEADAKQICGFLTDIGTHGDHQVIINDFKRHLECFQLPICRKRYQIYDLALATTPPNIPQVLTAMSTAQPKQWQNILANSEVAYQAIEKRGVLCGHTLKRPHWDHNTYSGRSRTTGLSIQGATQGDLIGNPSYTNSQFVHFDWIAADIRAVSIVSGDQVLASSFETSDDPYQAIADEINQGSGAISRDECKLALLAAINSMEIDAPILQPFPTLRRWMEASREHIRTEGWLAGPLQRKYRMRADRTELSVLNGVVQGMVATGIQNVFRQIWEAFGDRLLADTHDGIVVNSDEAGLDSTIGSVAAIMRCPFAEILPDNPVFPIRVSVGSRWKNWQPVQICR